MGETPLAANVPTSYGSGWAAGRTDSLDAYLWRPVLGALAGLRPGSRVLDAGCGNGRFARELARRGFSVCGVEIDAKGVACAREVCPSGHFERASVYDDLRGLLGAFDAVVSLEVVEHLFEPRAFVRRVAECLSPGGLFVLTTPYNGWFKNVAVALSGRFDRHHDPLWDGGHVKFWSRRTLTRLLEEGGFRVERFLGAGRLPYLWKSMVMVARLAG